MSAQSGQSLVEFAVGSAALLLLLLGVITLSGFQEVQRRATGAARQLALESTWLPEGTPLRALARRVHDEHLDDDGLLDAVGRARYVEAGDVRVSRQSDPAPRLAGDATVLLLTPLQTSRGLVGGDIDLEPGGYVNGVLALHLEPHRWLPEPFRDLEQTLSQPFSILSDAWNSSGPQHVRARSASLVPTQRLSSLSTLWETLAAPLSVVEPSIQRLCLGLIEPDLVPEDRLGPVVAGARAGRPCQ